MAKVVKKTVAVPAGMQGGGNWAGGSANTAGRLAGEASAFRGNGVTPANERVARAKNIIDSLTARGVKINPATATPYTRGKMVEAASPRGRLMRLLKVR